MASNLDCLGLGMAGEDALKALARHALSRASLLGTGQGVSVHRWEDPSGARLVLGLRGQELTDFLPSFAADPGVRFDGLRPHYDDVCATDVVDEQGTQWTAMTVTVEEYRLLTPPWSGEASVVAFGSSVTVHADEAAYLTSDASLLDPASKDEPLPPHLVERGMKGPFRMAAESFMSLGIFGPPERSNAFARLSGTVLSAERRTNTYSEVPFVAARVRTVGGVLTLCLSAAEHDVPAPGNVVTGEVFLVASTGAVAAGGRRWFGRRRG